MNFTLVGGNLTLKTVEEYFESVKKLKPKVYVAGEKIKNLIEHPNTRPAVNAIAKTYELAFKPEYKRIMRAKSHITGEEINRFNHVARSIGDLNLRVELAILTSKLIGTCNYRCAGCDVFVALDSITYEMDKKLGTNYYERFTAYLKYVQENDLACSGGLTDPKGDRRLRPFQQPDMYLRVVEKNDEGIIVRGAKLHQSGAFATHETIILPGLSLREGEEDYAVAFAVPNGAKGLTYILQETPEDAERREVKNLNYVGLPDYGVRLTCIMIFDDVFIPWDRVFMCGEVNFTRKLVWKFASTHRMVGAACKVGFGDLIIGATQAIAEYNGVAEAPHIRSKISEMIYLNEKSRACAIASALKGEPTESGAYFPHDIFANVAKLAAARGFHEMIKYAIDVAGGLVVTMPSESNLENPEIREYLKKYLRGVEEVPAERRMRMMKFLQNWVAGPHLAGAWHGGGSPEAQKLTIYALSNLKELKALAESISGVDKIGAK